MTMLAVERERQRKMNSFFSFKVRDKKLLKQNLFLLFLLCFYCCCTRKSASRIAQQWWTVASRRFILSCLKKYIIANMKIKSTTLFFSLCCLLSTVEDTQIANASFTKTTREKKKSTTGHTTAHVTFVCVKKMKNICNKKWISLLAPWLFSMLFGE